MKKILIFLLTIFLLASVSASIPKVYDINLHYAQGDFSLNNISIELGDISFENIPGDYTGELISDSGSLLDMFIFDIPSFIIAEDFEGQGNVIFYNESSFNIYAPYYENAKEIIFYDPEYVEILKINLEQFSIIPNNQIDLPEEKINQSNSENNAGQEQGNLKKSFADYWEMLLIILIILTGILINSLRKKK